MSDAVEQLVGLGFSDYEAKAYVTLLKFHSATGYQIAKESGVPRSMIYQVLDKLIARGAVLTQAFGDLVRYAPDPPELLLERMQGDLAERVASLTATLQEVAVSPYGPGQAWNIAGQQNILARAREMIENARRRVAVSVGDDDELDRLLLWIRRAEARGVATTTVAPEAYEAEGLTIVRCTDGAQFRQAVGHGLTLVVDGSEALLGEVDRSETAVWTTNAYVASWIEWCILRGLPDDRTLQPAADAGKESE